MDPRPNIALVPIEEDLDVTTVQAVRTTLTRLIDGGCRRIILNMSGATYVDSAGMALLLSAIRRMRKLGGLLSLTNVSDQVLHIFRRARLVDFAPVSDCHGADRAIPSPGTLPLWRTVVSVDTDNLAASRARVEHILEQESPLSHDELFDATLAVGEAVGNAVDHTTGAGVLVTLSGYTDRVVMEVTDHGPGFDPAAVTPRNDPFAERGRGIKLMRLLADSVSITPRNSGDGMLVRIVKLAHAQTD